MDKTVFCILFLFALILFVPGCMAAEGAQGMGVLEAPAIAQSDESTPMTDEIITADVNTTNISAILGDTILISLRENPTTGYSWNITKSTGLEIISDKYIMDNAEKGMVGVGGVHQWTVKTILAGNQTISAVMTRAEGSPTGEEKKYTLTIAVKEIREEKVDVPIEEIPRENRVAKYSVI